MRLAPPVPQRGQGTYLSSSSNSSSSSSSSYGFSFLRQAGHLVASTETRSPQCGHFRFFSRFSSRGASGTGATGVKSSSGARPVASLVFGGGAFRAGGSALAPGGAALVTAVAGIGVMWWQRGHLIFFPAYSGRIFSLV